MQLKSQARKKAVGEGISAEKPILKRKPLAEAISASIAGVIHIHQNAGFKALQPMSQTELEIRELFQKMTEVPKSPKVEVRLGGETEQHDEQLFLDAALAHGNPISRYVRTRKVEDYTDQDSKAIEGVPYLAPERMRRCVVSTTPKGDLIWGLLRDYVVETTITIERKGAVLAWYPKGLKGCSPKQYARLNRTTTRRYEVVLRYHPAEKIKKLEYHIDKTCEKQVDSSTRMVPGYYGVENIHNDRSELMRIAGIKNPVLEGIPDSMATWIEGEDLEKLKKKANKKMWASKNERMANNRTSWAFPSQLPYRPTPKRWWFLRNPDGMSQFYDDVMPWPNDIVAPDAWAALKEHNTRSAEWSNNEKVGTSPWVDEKIVEPSPTPAIVTSLVTDTSVEDGKHMVAIDEPEMESVFPQSVPIQRTLIKMDRPPAIPEKKEPPHWVTHRDKVRKHILSQIFPRVGEEASKPPVHEQEQTYIPRDEVPEEKVVRVNSSNLVVVVPVKPMQALSKLEEPAEQPTSPMIGPQVAGNPMFRIVTESGNLNYDLTDPEIFKRLDDQFVAIQKRIGALALVEDVLEEVRETAMRLQGKLKDDERYVRHNSLDVGMGGFTAFSDTFGTAPAQAREKPRMMKGADIGVSVTELGVILYGHGRNRVRSEAKPGLIRLTEVVRKMDAKEKSMAKQARKILEGRNRRFIAKKAMEKAIASKEWDTSITAVKNRLQDAYINILHDSVQKRLVPHRLRITREAQILARQAAKLKKILRQHAEWEKNKEQIKVDKVMRGGRYRRYNLDNGGSALHLRRERKRDIADIQKKIASQNRLDRLLTLASEMQEKDLIEERTLLRKARRMQNEVWAEQMRKNRERDEQKKQGGLFNQLKAGLKRIFGSDKSSEGGTVRETVIPIMTVTPIQSVESATQPSSPPVKITKRPKPKQAARIEERAMQLVAHEVLGGFVFERTESGIILPTKYEVPRDGDRLANVFERVRGI